MEKLFKSKIDPKGPFPKLTRRLRLGVVGGGRIAQTQSIAARLSDHWDVVAGVFSSDPERAQQRAADWFVAPERSYRSFEDMALAEKSRADGVEAVMITTPNHLHHDAAIAFAQAGIHVLCDKPLSNSGEEAKAMVEAGQEHDIVFGVSYVMSCYPMVRQAQELVRQGALGKINQIHVEFMQDWMTAEGVEEAEHVKWRLDPAKSGKTSCVGDIGTHAAHLASFVSGLEIENLRADFHICGAPKALEDTAFMNLKFEGDVPGTLMATRLAPGNRGGLRLRIFGSQGGIEWDMENAERLKLNQFGKPDQILTRGHGHGISPNVERFVRTGRGFPEGLIEAWANLYSSFAVKIAAKLDGLDLPHDYVMLPSVEDGAKGVSFIEASVTSNENAGTWVKVE